MYEHSGGTSTAGIDVGGKQNSSHRKFDLEKIIISYTH